MYIYDSDATITVQASQMLFGIPKENKRKKRKKKFEETEAIVYLDVATRERRTSSHESVILGGTTP